MDRAVANNGWRDIFPSAQIVHLVSPCSDHCSVLLNLVSVENNQPRQKCLHYEILWEREPDSAQVIKDSWSSSGEKSDLGDINRSLAKVMAALRSWSKTKVKNVGRELAKARKKLGDLIASDADNSQIRFATNQMNELLYKEEMLWLQRSTIFTALITSLQTTRHNYPRERERALWCSRFHRKIRVTINMD